MAGLIPKPERDGVFRLASRERQQDFPAKRGMMRKEFAFGELVSTSGEIVFTSGEIVSSVGLIERRAKTIETRSRMVEQKLFRPAFSVPSFLKGMARR